MGGRAARRHSSRDRAPERAVELLIGSAGGPTLALIPGSWRGYCLELLTRCWLALDCDADARRAAASAAAWSSALRLPLPIAWADRAEAAVALHAGDAARAAERSLAAAEGANGVGAPIEAALSLTLAGRALAQLGERDRALASLSEQLTSSMLRGPALPGRGGAGTRQARSPQAPSYACGQNRRERARSR